MGGRIISYKFKSEKHNKGKEAWVSYEIPDGALIRGGNACIVGEIGEKLKVAWHRVTTICAEPTIRSFWASLMRIG